MLSAQHRSPGSPALRERDAYGNTSTCEKRFRGCVMGNGAPFPQLLFKHKSRASAPKSCHHPEAFLKAVAPWKNKALKARDLNLRLRAGLGAR